MADDPLDDLAKLPSIDDAVVMQTLQARHENDLIYTKNGAVLVAINQYKDVPVYGDSQLDKYKKSLSLATEKPHIFAVAAATHRALISEGSNQAVVISGESGAGKTEEDKLFKEGDARLGWRSRRPGLGCRRSSGAPSRRPGPQRTWGR